jgi:hypothetical protein
MKIFVKRYLGITNSCQQQFLKNYKSLIKENACFFKQQIEFYSFKSRFFRKLSKLF